MRFSIILCPVAVLLCALPGCGLILQGRTQTLNFSTNPPGASASFGNFRGTTPATITMSRRVPDWMLLHASKDGYYPACQIVDCARPRKIKVLDAIFTLGIGNGIDAALGAYQNCTPAPIDLEPVGPDDIPYKLHSDEEIIHTRETFRLDMCRFPYLYDQEFAKAAGHIIVTAGGLNRPYDALGPVDFGRLGGDWFRFFAVTYNRMTFAQFSRTFSQATPAEVKVNALLALRALRQYGTRVDAVINVAYQDNPRHDVFGTGLAVHFTTQAEAPSAADHGQRSIESRLEELKRLLDKGLIDQQEYDRKRAAILREM